MGCGATDSRADEAQGRHHRHRRGHAARRRRASRCTSAGPPATAGSSTAPGACSDFEPSEFLSVKEVRRLDRFSQLALVAAGEALAQAGWDGELPYDPMRVGCVIATGIGGEATDRGPATT